MNAPRPASIACTAIAAVALIATLPAHADQGHDHATTATTATTESTETTAATTPAALYHDYCSVCHGDRGDGDSRARGSMVPPPKDFTAAPAAALGRDAMIAAVTKGKAGTAMAPWESQLSAAQIAGLVDYIRETFIAPGTSQANAEGARIYSRTCSVCHGDNGNGAVWATANLNPRPRDFTTTQAASELSRKRMLHSVTFGRPDTAMPGFGTQLDAAQVQAVVDYVRDTFMRTARTITASAAEPATGHGHDAGHDHDQHLGSAGVHAEPFPHGLVGDLKRGEALYRSNCVACHGERGNGQGPRAYFILPKPRNFTHPASRSAFNRPHLFQAISRGTLGSEMPAWDTVLDGQSIADIAEYVFQRFILGDATAAVASDVAARH